MTLEPCENILVKRYSESFLQLGYIVLFSPVFPLAAFFSLLCNLLEIKSTMNSFAYNSKRSIAISATGIGTWNNVLSFLALFSIPVNCGIIFYTSKSLPKFLSIEDAKEYKSLYYMLGFGIFLEHCIIFLKMFI